MYKHHQQALLGILLPLPARLQEIRKSAKKQKKKEKEAAAAAKAAADKSANKQATARVAYSPFRD